MLTPTQNQQDGSLSNNFGTKQRDPLILPLVSAMVIDSRSRRNFVPRDDAAVAVQRSCGAGAVLGVLHQRSKGFAASYP